MHSFNHLDCGPDFNEISLWWLKKQLFSLPFTAIFPPGVDCRGQKNAEDDGCRLSNKALPSQFPGICHYGLIRTNIRKPGSSHFR